MNDYIKSIEQQNEELKQLLANVQTENMYLNDRIKIYDSEDPFDSFIAKMRGDFKYRNSIKMMMKKAICVHTPLTENGATEVMVAIMYDVFNQGQG